MLVDIFVAGRMPLDRFIARYDFADFNRATADATSGAAIKPAVLLRPAQAISRTRLRAVIVSGKPYLIDADMI